LDYEERGNYYLGESLFTPAQDVFSTISIFNEKYFDTSSGTAVAIKEPDEELKERIMEFYAVSLAK
jgi:hypothetical protein